MVFNVLATNYDDHTKNFSFILRKDDSWRLAPAYDLCFSYAPDNYWVNQQALSVNGKRLHINREDLLTVARANSIKRGDEIIDEVNLAVNNWREYADQAEVRMDLVEFIAKNLNVF
jgi:serine/threonine-protein kinase HipA